MKSILAVTFFFCFINIYAQQDSTLVYKKRVLETTEVDFLSSYYSQEGDNASVTGGIGTEELTDLTAAIIVSMPLNDDDVLTLDAGFSSYTSASSSNADALDGSNGISPWSASSGASEKDLWFNVNANYSHSSNDRNTIWDANISVASEYDYFSLGFGGGLTKLFNEKNTTLGVSAKVYLDKWNPIYPRELISFEDNNGSISQDFLNGYTILNQNGNVSTDWNPSNFQSIVDEGRNTYSISLSVSQILSKNAQFSLFLDLVKQQGWLGNPLQRVYFQDVANFYVGNAANIPNYTTTENTDVFQLADDIERLPDNRFKIPLGFRLNYYLNEIITVRTYYRYYFDDWGIKSNTASIEIPIKVSQKFTLYPSYRYYNQTEADYFAPYEANLSTDEFYTSDFDLSKFSANQYGFGISYTDIFSTAHIWKFGLKSIDFKYNNYKRNTGLSANYFGLGLKMVMD